MSHSTTPCTKWSSVNVCTSDALCCIAIATAASFFLRSSPLSAPLLLPAGKRCGPELPPPPPAAAPLAGSLPLPLPLAEAGRAVGLRRSLPFCCSCLLFKERVWCADGGAERRV